MKFNLTTSTATGQSFTNQQLSMEQLASILDDYLAGQFRGISAMTIQVAGDVPERVPQAPQEIPSASQSLVSAAS